MAILPDAVKAEYLCPSTTHTACPVNRNVAWCYPQSNEAAKHIQGYIAFRHGVQMIT